MFLTKTVPCTKRASFFQKIIQTLWAAKCTDLPPTCQQPIKYNVISIKRPVFDICYYILNRVFNQGPIILIDYRKAIIPLHKYIAYSPIGPHLCGPVVLLDSLAPSMLSGPSTLRKAVTRPFVSWQNRRGRPQSFFLLKKRRPFCKSDRFGRKLSRLWPHRSSPLTSSSLCSKQKQQKIRILLKKQLFYRQSI